MPVELGDRCPEGKGRIPSSSILYLGKALAGDRVKIPEYAYTVEQCDVPEARRAALDVKRRRIVTRNS